MSFVNGYRQQQQHQHHHYSNDQASTSTSGNSNPGGMSTLPPSGMPPVHYVPTYLPSSAEAHAQASSASRPTVATASQLNFGTSAAPGNAAYHPPTVHHHVGWPYTPVHPNAIYPGPPVYGTLPDFNKPPYTTANMGQSRVPPVPYPGTISGAPAPVSINANAPGLGASSFRPSRDVGQSIPADAEVPRQVSNGGVEPARMQAAFRPLPAPGFLPVSWYQPLVDSRMALAEQLANQQQHLARLQATTRMQQQQQQRLAERVREDELRDLLDVHPTNNREVVNEDKTPKPRAEQTQTSSFSGGQPWQSRFFPPAEVFVPPPPTYASDGSTGKDRWELLSSSSSATAQVQTTPNNAVGDSVEHRATDMIPTQVEYMRYGDPRFASDPTPAAVPSAATEANKNVEPAIRPEQTRDTSVYGLKAEDIFGVDDFTTSTPSEAGNPHSATTHAGLPAWASFGFPPHMSMPAAAAMPPPASPVIAQRYLDNLIKNSLNTSASVALLRILKDEGVALDSSLGLKLLDLAQDLQSTGPHFRNTRASAGFDDGTKKSRPLPVLKKKITNDQIMDKLNEFVPVLNTIAGAVGISLWEDPKESASHKDSHLIKTSQSNFGAPIPMTEPSRSGQATLFPTMHPRKHNALGLQGSGVSSSEASGNTQDAIRPFPGLTGASYNGTRMDFEARNMDILLGGVLRSHLDKVNDNSVHTEGDNVGSLLGGLSLNNLGESKDGTVGKVEPTKHVAYLDETKETKDDEHAAINEFRMQDDSGCPDHLSTAAVKDDDGEEPIGQHTPVRPSRSLFHFSPNTPDLTSRALRPRSENRSVYGPHYDRHGIQVPWMSLSERPRWWSYHPYFRPEHEASRMAAAELPSYYGASRQDPVWPNSAWGHKVWGSANPTMYGYNNYGEPIRPLPWAM